MLAGLGDSWAATRAWVKGELADLVGIADPAAIRLVADGNGRPSVEHPGWPAGWDLNLSHTDTVIALAAGRGRLGIDVEDEPTAASDVLALAEVVGTRRECDELAAAIAAGASGPTVFTQWWVRKEAVLKAVGIGFGSDPRAVHVGVTTVAPLSPWRVIDLGRLDLSVGPWLALATDHPVAVHVTHR